MNVNILFKIINFMINENKKIEQNNIKNLNLMKYFLNDDIIDYIIKPFITNINDVNTV